MLGLVYSQGDSQGANRPDVSRVLEDASSAAAVETLASYKVVKEYGDSRFYQGDSTKFGCFIPDGSQFAVGASGPSVDYMFTKPRLTIWTSTGEAIEHFALDVVSGTYSPDGRSLYVLDESGVVYSYDTTSWQCTASKEYTVTRPGRRRSYRITGPFLWQVSKDCLALLDSGYGLRLLDANTLDVQETLPVPGFRAAAVAPDGASFLLYCDPNDPNEDKWKHVVELYETATGGLLESFGHESRLDLPVLAIRQDNGMLAVSNGRKVTLYDIKSGDETVLALPSRPPESRSGSDKKGVTVCYFPEAVDGLAFSPDGKFLLASATDETLTLFDIENASQVRRESMIGHFRTCGIVFEPDGEGFLLLGHNLSKKVQLYDFPELQPRTTPHKYYGSGRIYFAPDGKYFVSLCENYQIRVFDSASGEVIKTLQHNYPINDVVFLHDGSQMITADNKKKICVWDTKTWQVNKTLSDHEGMVTSVRLDTQGRYMYSGDGNGKALLWEIGSFEKLHEFCISATISGIAVRESRLVLTTNAATAEVFDLESMERIGILEVKPRPECPKTHYIKGIAYSPDGKVLAIASSDGIIYLWDSNSLERLGVIQGRGYYPLIKFSPRGDYILCSSLEGLRVYHIRTGELVFVYDESEVTNVGRISQEDGVLTLTMGTAGYTAKTIEIYLNPVDS